MSLVVLFSICAPLSLGQLRVHLDSAFPGEFLPPREQGSFVVEQDKAGGLRLIKSDVQGAKGIFLFHNVAGRHPDVSDYLGGIDDPALRQTAREQRCWMSVDLIKTITTEREAERFIAKATAQLAPPDAAVLVNPSNGVAIRFNDDVRRQLALGRPGVGPVRR